MGIVAAIIYIAIALPYGDLSKTKVYNLEIIQILMIPLTAFIGALLGILLTNNKDKP
jgi:ABC-type multidrug transport system permease subunit